MSPNNPARCSARYDGPYDGGVERCHRPGGHDGDHRCYRGGEVVRSWSSPSSPVAVSPVEAPDSAEFEEAMRRSNAAILRVISPNQIGSWLPHLGKSFDDWNSPEDAVYDEPAGTPVVPEAVYLEAARAVLRGSHPEQPGDPDEFAIATIAKDSWHRRVVESVWAAALSHVQAETAATIAKITEERDLAIAHDTQPYPTADAYNAACAALHKHRERADKAEAEVARLTAELADAGGYEEFTLDGPEETILRPRGGWEEVPDAPR